LFGHFLAPFCAFLPVLFSLLPSQYWGSTRDLDFPSFSRIGRRWVADSFFGDFLCLRISTADVRLDFLSLSRGKSPTFVACYLFRCMPFFCPPWVYVSCLSVPFVICDFWFSRVWALGLVSDFAASLDESSCSSCIFFSLSPRGLPGVTFRGNPVFCFLSRSCRSSG